MPPEDDDDQLDDQDRDDQDIEGLGDKGKAALERERQARKQATRSAREQEKRANDLAEKLRVERFGRLKSQHSWLEEDDLKDIDLDAWDAKIERLAKIASVATSEETQIDASDQANAADKAEVQRFTQQAGGTGPAAPGKTYTATEVREIGLRNQAEAPHHPIRSDAEPRQQGLNLDG